MADAAAPVSTPVTPVTPSAPTQVTPPVVADTTKPPHHSANQPRTPVGTFDKKTDAPQFLELDGKRLPMEEVRTLLAERREDARAEQQAREELERLRAEAQRWKNPTQSLTREQRIQIARAELEEFQRQQEEAKLPPEQRAFLQQRREFERQQEEFRRQQEEEQQRQQNAMQAQQRQQAVANVQAALKHLGVDENDSLALRLVVDEFWTASQHGKQYSPEVVARRVQRQLDSLATQRAAKLGPKALLSNAEFVTALNGLDDADLLKALAPLGERLRALNLQARGITPPSQPQPSNVVPLQPGQNPRTDTEWIAYFRSNGPPPPDSGAAHAKYWALKDRGVL